MAKACKKTKPTLWINGKQKIVLMVISIICLVAILYLGFTTKASVALIQTATGSIASSGTVTATFSTVPTQGNLLVAIAGARNGFGGGVTFDDLNGWSTAINETGWSDVGGDSPSQAIYYRIAGAEEPVDVTVTLVGDSSDMLGLQLYEYSGIDTESPFNQASSAWGNSNNAGSGSITTTQANELILVGVTVREDLTMDSWTNGFVEQNDFAAAGCGAFCARYGGADFTATRIGTFSTSADLLGVSNEDWRGQIVSFRVTGGDDFFGRRRTAFPANMSLNIEGGNDCTTNRNVLLTLSSQRASSVLISENPDFQHAKWSDFTDPMEYEWLLSEGDGLKTIYVIYRSFSMDMSPVVQQSIMLDRANGCSLGIGGY